MVNAGQLFILGTAHRFGFKPTSNGFSPWNNLTYSTVLKFDKLKCSDHVPLSLTLHAEHLCVGCTAFHV